MNLQPELRITVVIHEGVTHSLGDLIGAESGLMEFPLVLNPVAIRRLHEAELALGRYGWEETRELAIARTSDRPNDVYRILGGQTFDAMHLVDEIKQATPIGVHFAEIQRNAALIAIRVTLRQASGSSLE